MFPRTHTMSSLLQHRRRGGQNAKSTSTATTTYVSNSRDRLCEVEMESGTGMGIDSVSGSITPTASNNQNKNSTIQSPSSPSSLLGDNRRRWSPQQFRYMKGYDRFCRHFQHQSTTRTSKIVVLFGCTFIIIVTAITAIFVVHYIIFCLRSRFSARIPIAGVDIQVPTEENWPLIHIVHTRFMQEQGALETLGMARFHLFMTFCFPTIVAQSTQKFFWIIKTDPRFTTTTVFSLLLDAVKDHSNIYVVASNCNYSFGNGGSMWCWGGGKSWRDGAEPRDVLTSNVYSGDMHKLHQAMALRDDRIVLETRLDADDGLHQYYLQYMQYVALNRFHGLPMKAKYSHHNKGHIDSNDDHKESDGEKDDENEHNDEDENDRGHDNIPLKATEHPPQWLYWCTRRHLEWHSEIDNNRDRSSSKVKSRGDELLGLLTPIQHERLCITPGITVGYNVHTDPSIVPRYDHDKLLLAVNGSHACYDDIHADETTEQAIINTDKNALGKCLELVDDFSFCAVRSRTWTSAGMQRVPLDPRAVVERKLEKKLWQLLTDRFNMNQTRVRSTQEFLFRNRKLIAQENIVGQCTTGHSCKSTAKSELRKYIEADDRK